jgi:hypothetical protein
MIVRLGSPRANQFRHGRGDGEYSLGSEPLGPSKGALLLSHTTDPASGRTTRAGDRFPGHVSPSPAANAGAGERRTP